MLAAQRPTPESRAALAELCHAYWYPLYAFARRRGRNADEARDSTQAFFVRLLEHNDLASVDPRRGRFRSWLLAALTHFLANEWDKERAQKRGGDATVVSIDAAEAEGRYLAEPSHQLTPEKLYERKWALALLDRVLAALGADYARRGKTALFEGLKPTLTGDPHQPYAALGAQLGLSEGAVKVAAYWLRHRYEELLRAEILDTVGGPEEVEDEIAQLIASLS